MDNGMESVKQIMQGIVAFAVSELPKMYPSIVRTKKDAADFVSNRDLAMEEKILDTIHAIYPDHTVISEEIGMVGSEEARHQWLVDPIDGSCNDSHGVPWSCVSVAYAVAGHLQAGLVINPHTSEVFEAYYGEGATLNGEPIHVSNTEALSGTVVMTELLNQYPWHGMAQFMEELADRDATVRIMGSTALAIVQVATGRAAAATFADAGLLDVAAAVLIAMEAGAVVSQDGTPTVETIPNGKFIISCPGVMNEMQASLTEFTV